MRRFSLASVLLVAVLAVFGTSTTSRAVFLHNFNCAYCHVPGTNYATLTADNVCLQCHKPSPPSVTFADGISRSSDAGFMPNDASNAMGSRPATVVGGAQTSHLWASSKNAVPAAGATAPGTTFYKSNYNTSTGKMTCSICHNPHADVDPTKRNVNSLRPVIVQPAGTNVANQACLACHGSWNSATTHGRGTHPINIAYPGVNANDGYVDSAPSDANLTLVGGKVTCVTCHGTHFTDSDALTADGPSLPLTASTRGVLLKGNGPEREAATGTGICTSCHEYSAHGGAATSLGCMECHGGHNASDGSDPNIFMLNRTITIKDLSTPDPNDTKTVTLSYTTYPPTVALFQGVCTTCHSGFVSASHYGPDCTSCHTHDNAAGSFTPSCTSCHGFPPTAGTPSGPTGYAVAPDTTFNYLSNNGGITYRDEATTGHSKHANNSVAGNYAFACAECHKGNTHNVLASGPTFQDVFVDTTSILASKQGSVPTYTKATSTCGSNVYCHSDGRSVRAGGATYKAVPAWAGGGTTCSSCHNTGTTGTATVHNTHLALAGATKLNITCDTCHTKTSADGATLKATATGTGGVHVDGIVTVDGAFNTLTPAAFNTVDGKCAVYCHTNGISYSVQPDWDDVTTGDCGDCHAVTGGVPVANGGLSVAHDKHLAAGITCNTCHPHDGSTFGGSSGHINKVKDTVAGVCNGCHGSVNAGTGNDREPVWTDPDDGSVVSVDCSTCHLGSAIAVIGGKGGVGTYVDQSEFAAGHGKTGIALACTGCHDASAAGHFDGNTNPRLKTDPKADGGAEDYTVAANTWCQDCHTATTNAHYAPSGTACAACHEPHGKGMSALGNTSAMLVVGKGFTSKTDRYSYINAGPAFDGVCQVCHSAATVSWFNTTTYDDNHNPGKVCTECHKHDATPAFKAGCTDCHGNTATGNYWPDSDTYGVENGTIWPNRLGSHDIHVTKIAKVKYATASPTVTQKNATCDYCHTGGGHSGEQASAPADLGGFKNILGAANVRTVSTSQVGTDVTCSNVDCHYTTSPVATDWYTAGDQALANCSYCHVYTGTYVQGTLPNAHDKHMGETADGGRNMDCLNCHLSPGIDVAHQNGVIDFSAAAAPLETILSIDTATTAGSKLGPKYGAVGAVATEFSTCANLECHGNFTGGTAANAPNWFNTDAQKGVGLGDGRCGTCHGSDSAATPTSNKHTVHLGSDTYVPGNCDDCHTKTVATHVYGSIDLGGNATVASAPGCTNACHTLDGLDNSAAATADNPSWTSANKLGCEDCHASGKTWAGAGGALLTRGLPPTSGKHGDHVGGYFAAGCVDCHASNAVTHSVLNNIVAVSGNKVSVYGAGTCTNTCHTLNGVDNAVGGGNDATWTAANLLGCVDCHSSGLTGLRADLAPTTGLHAGTLTISANTHDESFKATRNEATPSAGCTSCHTATPSTNHIDGTFTTSWNAVAPSVNFAATVGFLDAATPTCGPNGALVTCHDDGGAWKRKWSVTARNDATPLNECANCHGDFATGFVSGMSLRHQTTASGDVDGDIAAGHDTCNTCHTYKDGVSTYYDFAVQHRDGSIQLNNGMGFTDPNIDGLVGCTGCHVATGGTVDEGHQFEDTESTDGLGINRWTRTLQAGPPADCAGCHNTILGTAHASAGESLSTHDLHTGSLYYDSVTAKCTMCHDSNGSGGTHNNGTVNFANNMSNTLNYPRTGFSNNCATANGCHSSDNGEWVSGNLGADACADCHVKTGTLFTAITSSAYPPNTGAHAAHNANAAYVGTNDCSKCHGANANLGTHGTHKNKSLDNTVSYATGNQTCTNNCHLADTAGDWTTSGTLACADCHNADGNAADLGTYSLDQGNWPPATNKHSQHLGSNALPQASPNDCFACHDTTVDNAGAIKAAGTHVSGGVNVAFNSGYGFEGVAGTRGATTGTATVCSNILCHNGVASPTWAAASTISCGKCHNTGGTGPLPSGSTLGNHVAHANNDGDFADCANCHVNVNSYSATGGHTDHQNLAVNIAPLAGSYSDAVASVATNSGAGVNYGGDFVDNGTCSNVSCHYNNMTPGWGGTITGCTACHNDGTNDQSLTHAVPSATAAIHTDHVGSAASVTYLDDCNSCHGANANAGNHTGHGNLSVNYGGALTSYDGVNTTCVNTCHVAGNGDWSGTGALVCADCHVAAKMGDMGTGNHAIHTSGVFPAAYDTAGRAASTTDYRFYCANCHGTTLTNHMNAVNNVSGVGYAGSGGACNATYCHSDGAGSNKTTPAWVGGAFTGDRCDECHGNSPTTNAHSVHAVGIHATDIYSGATGLLTTATATKAHGDPATSTTINCNICHSATVTMARNKLGTLCVGCHTVDASNATNLMSVADTSKHVDNSKQVAFSTTLSTGGFKSKAQLRDDITTVPSLTASWTRSGAYKAAAGYDAAKAAAPQFLGGKCSAIDCHNGIEATWAVPANDCMACHTELPK